VSRQKNVGYRTIICPQLLQLHIYLSHIHFQTTDRYCFLHRTVKPPSQMSIYSIFYQQFSWLFTYCYTRRKTIAAIVARRRCRPTPSFIDEPQIFEELQSLQSLLVADVDLLHLSSMSLSNCRNRCSSQMSTSSIFHRRASDT